MFEKDEIYLSSPNGEMRLAEIFREGERISILLAGHERVDLDMDSALDLVETILMLTGEVQID